MSVVPHRAQSTDTGAQVNTILVHGPFETQVPNSLIIVCYEEVLFGSSVGFENEAIQTLDSVLLLRRNTRPALSFATSLKGNRQLPNSLDPPRHPNVPLLRALWSPLDGI